ncbi:lipocalin-like domain-containing protein [Streptomyces sp. RS10V-4]|uniref:lipocalin-like domain-containing protein n=1 Tax=Streptomyces rhizoryzae TaxID=2932493 RepID=UPI0020069284|nr:lipocalin-like domain-containing protein [Streptomyces rhizoryzae]MCK7625839.1 lipocalin-like domain-containing protein [Streptomyces rhizoryzae]
MRTDPEAPDPAPPAAPLTAAQLTGSWRLLAFHETDAAGTVTGEGPLGPDPRGRLVYLPDGQVSVHMMRSPDAPDGTPSYMGYAGTWRLVDGRTVVHRITLTPRRDWIGTEQTRRAALAGDRLTLHAATRIGGRPHHRVLVWQRLR